MKAKLKLWLFMMILSAILIIDLKQNSEHYKNIIWLNTVNADYNFEISDEDMEKQRLKQLREEQRLEAMIRGTLVYNK